MTEEELIQELVQALKACKARIESDIETPTGMVREGAMARAALLHYEIWKQSNL